MVLTSRHQRNGERMIRYQLKHLVIKPTLACTANCLTCSCRRELHREVKRDRILSYEDWENLFFEANDLGVGLLTISGGEPTLYKKLLDLIKVAKGHGWRVHVNSNGSLINEQYARKLLDAGLNGMIISLYSPSPEIHDTLRRSKGLWGKATDAIKIMSRLEKQFPEFKIRSQTLLMRENYKLFPELLKLHYELGSNQMVISYLEGDYDAKYLMNEREIQDFRENVTPRAIEVCKKLLDAEIRERAIDKIKNIFSPQLLSLSQWAKGMYQPTAPTEEHCERPANSTIILANGDVHPCNIVEYTHEPIMGNLFEQTFTEIWHGKKWNDFRHTKFDKCKLCPMNMGTFIDLTVSPYRKSNFSGRVLKKVYHKIRPVFTESHTGVTID